MASVTNQTTTRVRRKSLRQQMWDARHCYLIMIPGLVLIGMFSVYPLVASWIYSFYDWDGISSQKYFIGFDNFREIVHDHQFWEAFWRSVWFSAVSTPVMLILSLIVAIILNDKSLKLGPVFRTLFFIPVVTTTAIVSIVMSFVFTPYKGPINEVLTKTGITSGPIDFLGNPHTVMWTAIGIFCWKWFGQPMIYWLAGLQTIPDELYEAARVDGASAWRIRISITAPLLAPFAAIIGLITLVGNMQVFAFMQALTNGGPFFSSEVMELFIYRTAFGASGTGASATRLGYASAAGVLFGLAVMVLAALQLFAMRKLRPSARMAGAR